MRADPNIRCGYCDEIESGDTVQCDGCQTWFHFECVGVTSEVEGVEWQCSRCVINAANGNIASGCVSEATGTDVQKLLSEQAQRFQEEAATQERRYLTEASRMMEVTSQQRAEQERRHNEEVKELRKMIADISSRQTAPFSTGALPKQDRPTMMRSSTEIQGPFERENVQQLDERQGTHRSVDFSFFANPRPYEQTARRRSENQLAQPSNANQPDLNRSQQENLLVTSQLAVTMKRQYMQKLPKFGGAPKEWAFFEAVYSSTTIEGQFTETENVFRLREALISPALDLVLDQVMFSTNATRIMADLKDAYGRADRLILELTKEILAIPPLRKSSDPKLRDLGIAMKNFVAKLKSLQRPGDLRNDYTLGMMSDKLQEAPGIYKEWARRKLANPEEDLDSFAQFLMEKVSEMPPGLLPAAETTARTKPALVAPVRRHNAHLDANQSRSATKAICISCQGSHPLWKCSQFLDLKVRERREFAKENRICFACLNSTEHRARACHRNFKCGVAGCGRSHNRLLHEETNSAAETRGTATPLQLHEVCSSSESESSEVHHLSHRDGEEILYKILPVKLYGPDRRCVETFALLDGGSAITLMNEEVAQKLGLTGTSKKLTLLWTAGIVREEEALLTTVGISGAKGGKRYDLNNVYSVKDLELPEQTVDPREMKKRYPHLKRIPIPAMTNAKPMILIGLDQASFLIGGRKSQGADDQPKAIETRLGWTVFGKNLREPTVTTITPARKPTMRNMHHVAVRDAEHSRDLQALHKMVKDYFTTENFGVAVKLENNSSEDELRALDIMERTLKYDGKRYEIGLLWRSDDVKLPESLSMSMSRLRGLERKLSKDPLLLDWVNAHMRSLVEKGYARVASADELSTEWPRIWYPPSFVVHNMNKVPPKPRMVTDVAARVEGQSLNSNLLPGPDNLAPLLAGLFKFRENAIAVTADVREMFHQVRIRAEDQQCQRLLWRDGDSRREPTVYIMEAMMFGPTCSPACAQYVKNQHAKQYETQYPEAVDALINRTYVDDYLNSEKTVERASRVLDEATEICQTMGFQLVAVQSSSESLLKARPEHTLKDKLMGSGCSNLTSKVLGMMWNSQLDHFMYKLFPDATVEKTSVESYQPTKREVLSTLMKIYDPLGLVAHYLIRGRMVLQEIWRDGTDWDEAISAEQRSEWISFTKQLAEIEHLEIPRQYAPLAPSESRVQLVVFVDASERAFAATAFFRFESESEVHVAHVMAKAKVAPIKQLSIPQLELQAAVLGIRLANTVKKHHAFEVHETIYLADAKVVLSWICSRKGNFKPFVAVRIGEILEASSRKDWHHVSSRDNVADDATKWNTLQMGDEETRWFKGPAFLRKCRSEWPVTSAEKMRTSENSDTQRMMVHKEGNQNFPRVTITRNLGGRILSRWTSTVRVVAFLLRWRDSKFEREKVGYITPTEFERSESLMFREVQQEVYAEEITALTANRVISARSKILSLTPIMGPDQVIRLSSRAQGAPVSYAARNPAILPNRHALVELLIRHHHENNLHMGETTTIADLRERAWIVNIRTAVRRVIKSCQSCRIRKAKPATPMMGQLPLSRFDYGCKPFTHTGVDCFGPLEVKCGRGKQKRYGIIFTCLTYRAIHLELINDMSTDECLSAIRRLVTHRGKVQLLYSDNGKNFVGANNQLARDGEEVAKVMGEAAARRLSVEWRFIPAYSPWMGGAWERMIGTVKRAVNFMIGQDIPHEHVLRNALSEAQYQMNRRPLTHLPVYGEDPKPLTPNLMMFGDDSDNEVLGIFTESDAFSSKAYRRAQHLAQKYTSRWFKEYLPEITRRSKWHKGTPPIEVGSLVMLIEPDERGTMAIRRGIVSRVYPGPDAVVRQADVRLSDGKVKLRRAVRNLALLDLMSSTPEIESQTARGLSSSEANE